MATKAQHSPDYEPLKAILRTLREEAELTQRDLGELLGKPQSWIHNCEVGNRRVDVAEFAGWTSACGVEPTVALARFLAANANPVRAKRANAEKPQQKRPKDSTE